MILLSTKEDVVIKNRNTCGKRNLKLDGDSTKETAYYYGSKSR